jgi:lipopolysaccharide export system protein LptA
MVYAAPMNKNCFSREGAKAQRTFFSCLSCLSWFKRIFMVNSGQWHLVFLEIMMLFLAMSMLDQNVSAFDKGNENSSIQIKADNLVAYNEASYAEFTGNVSAAQGTILITSDKLKIYYTKALENKGKKDTGEESIKKVVVSGNVVIRSENRTAHTSMAEYTPASKVIVLSGAGSKVTSGNSFVSGEKITFYVNEDRVIVERGKEKQVEAIFYSGELEKKPD